MNNLEANKTYCGDNLVILKDFPDNSIDLIYIDPPYFTQKNMNDFSDEWKDLETYLLYIRKIIHILYRILKKTGSFYLHCDYHAVHYIKKICDEIFGYENFINEIIWCYHKGGNIHRSFKRNHDTVLFYSKSNEYVFFPQKKYIRKEKKKYKKNIIVKTDPVLEDWWDDIPSRGTATQSKEWVNYETQKPEKLLERIIKSSSKRGDVILDAFCGSGTTCVVAKKLRRKYIGIDKNDRAIRLTEDRLRKIALLDKFLNNKKSDRENE